MGSRAHPFNVRRSIGDLRRTVFSLFHEYIVGGYISLSLESLSRGMHQSLSIFFFSRVTSPFLPVLQPRCAIRGLRCSNSCQELRLPSSENKIISTPLFADLGC